MNLPTRLAERALDVGCEVGFYGNNKTEKAPQLPCTGVPGPPISPLKLSTAGLVLVVGAVSVLVLQISHMV
jgi:hypothetical protein